MTRQAPKGHAARNFQNSFTLSMFGTTLATIAPYCKTDRKTAGIAFYDRDLQHTQHAEATDWRALMKFMRKEKNLTFHNPHTR